MIPPQRIPPLGRPPIYSKSVLMVHSAAATRYVRPARSLNVPPLAMGSISQSIPYPYLGLAEGIILANQVLRCQGICAVMPKMSETREYQHPWCYATEQPLDWNFRRMGKWLHESFPMPEHCKYILVAVDTMCPNGLKHFLCCGRLKEFKEDGSGNHVSLLWISKSHA